MVIYKSMKDHTLERSHTSAKLVTSGLLGKEICKYMKDLTLEKDPFSAKLVISGLRKKKI